MKIRKATLADIDTIVAIYDYAIDYMNKNNNPDQWKSGYPGTEMINKDIEAGHHYLCIEDERILGVFYFAVDQDDPNYERIFLGSWLNEEPYGTIHRIATIKNKSGVASFCVDYCYAQCQNIRIDTHQDNRPMRNFLTKKGFRQCGLIYLSDGSERIGYQKCE